MKSSVSLEVAVLEDQTMAPKVAERLSRLRTSALIGMTTEPNWMNSTTKVMRAMIPSGQRAACANSDVLGVDELGRLAGDLRRERRVGGPDGLDEVPRPRPESGSTSGTTER